MFVRALLVVSALGALASTVPSVEQQLAAGVTDPLDLSNKDAAWFIDAAARLPNPRDPAQPTEALRQVTRAQLITENARRQQGPAKRQSSSRPVACISDTEPLQTGVQAAVFTNVMTTDTSSTTLGQTDATDIAACAKYGQSFTDTTIAYILGGQCYAVKSPSISGMAAYNGDDQFAFVDTSCAVVKAFIR